MTEDQREDLSLTGASKLGVHLTEDAVDVLVNETDGRPYSILFTLQQVQSSDWLDSEAINKLLEQTDEEAWEEQRRNIIISLPIAEYLLTSIVHFSSAGVTPLESSILRYTQYLAEENQVKNIPRHSMIQAQKKWVIFDIVASKGLYTIPEPLLLPLLINVDDARTRLSNFVESYNPGWFVNLIQLFFKFLDLLAQIKIKIPQQKRIQEIWKQIKKLIPSHPLFRKIRRKIGDSITPIFEKINRLFSSWEYKAFFSWSVDKAFLLSELGNKAQKREYFTSQVIANRGRQALNRGDYDEAIDNLTKALVLDERKVKAYRWRGLAQRNKNKYEEALADFDRAIEIDPDYAWAIAQRGITYQYLERYEEALKDFDRAIELDPEMVWAIAHRGITYRQMELYEEALKDFDRAIELDPDDAWAIAQRGITYGEMERYKEALADFDRAIELDPDYAWAIAQRGITYRYMERYEEALADFDRTIELDPDYAWAIAQRGITYQYLERYEEALKDFDRAIELDPEMVWAIAHRGITYRQMELYEEALTDINIALEINSDNDWYYYERAIIHKLLNQKAQASKDILSAINIAENKYKQNPSKQRNSFNLALYYLTADEFEKSNELYPSIIIDEVQNKYIRDAIKDLSEFLELFPNHEFARDMHDFLSKTIQEKE